MDRISVRGLATAIRLIREPVVVTYSYPRSHPLYGAGEECGVFVPAKVWDTYPEYIRQTSIDHGVKMPEIEPEVEPIRFKT